jgi:tetratricopeptide (TPR) repeat protein
MRKISLPRRLSLAVLATLTITMSAAPSWAGDPFRSSNPRNIDSNTEAAFRSIFQEGDYPAAQQYLQQAEVSNAGEPLVYAMIAALAHTQEDWGTLDLYGVKTLETAQQIMARDPLRGHIYTAVGNFLQGAASLRRGERVGILLKLQQVFQSLDQANKISPQDPELNLLKGYMDLLLAVHMPFSSPDQAIAKLQNYGTPDYLVYRGVAIAYRDLKNYPQALEYVDRALEITPNNPELHYLKAQIIFRQGNNDQRALRLFNRVMAKQEQLPRTQVAQIVYERCVTENRLDTGVRDCVGQMNTVRQNGGE